jgi:hypothetical protein
MFEHYVITRFNLKFSFGYDTDKNGNLTQTETWLNHRFDLFNTYCYPSLKGQSCLYFKWLVLFDVDTPKKFLEKIDFYKKDFPNFYPIFIENGEHEILQIEINNAIDLLSNNLSTHIITTRLDNDDVFHKDIIMKIQAFYLKNNEDNVFLNFNYGIQYDLTRMHAVKMRYENNHFISLIEKRHNFIKTVLLNDHTKIHNFGKVFSIENKSKPLWIEIVHNSNVSNQMKISMPLFLDTYFKSFSIEINIDKKQSFISFLYFLKFTVYNILASFFMAIGLFDMFKKIIKMFKR